MASRSFGRVVLLSIGLAACGGDDGSAATDDALSPDASGPDAQTEACTAHSSYRISAGQAPTEVMTLETGAILGFEARAGVGSTDALGPGTYPITADANLNAECGLCLTIFTDVQPMQCPDPLETGATASGAYIATSGTLTVTTSTGANGSSTWTAALSDVTFEHAHTFQGHCDLGAGALLHDGCTTTLEAATLSSTTAP